ncbi:MULTISPECIES: glycerate kinase [unclassified Brachybacterium]|uniref:glycerate kinase n=1 Tax=unclassified Brachybacterium TaxID=2623841 RepID=UPI000C8081AE|nr:MULTISPECIES: glycerate kinase [unclassified Brachybacterium]PMC76563.1 glycerate kinase [Brachybacterium sp. UMB0905]
MTRTILLAPDKFKGTLSAAQVAAALRHGITATDPHLEVLTCPIADGGDGTVDAALAAGFTERTATVTGPTGAPHEARYAVRERTAVLELASTVGLQALPGGELAPHTASTAGLGELIRAAADAGARTIQVGLGGSASTDAGAGLLQALGARLLDAQGHDIPPGLQGLSHLADVDLAPARRALDGVTLVVLTDVDSPLTGPDGAAAVFGPQKGLQPHEIASADQILAQAGRLLDASGELAARPGAGAAGGTGAALLALGARQRSGAEALLELTGFDQLLERADVVVTGEGKLDAQTLQGKGPAEVARRARARDLPLAAVAGRITLDPRQLADLGVSHATDLTKLAGSAERALAHGAQLLEEAGEQIAVWIATHPTGSGGPLP